ncbi:proton-dependent oligopeptide transporter, POT family [Sinosporangium album]|uniref:Proton-dependent oligopeptide transporter, POT family n=1 Tax=Sinosporangium album TaxID=504805 RepID=A0A1G8G0P4_9ACTN|nr:oligopeptide:H+ symporter [Sinosporangium album]SDH87954.1 proton-dependent oligopeptide transporter, POT family [Sinosporangium album]
MAERTLRARERSFFGHPRGLATLFGTEMWERFSFYGLRAILALFLAAPPVRNGLGLPAATAYAVVGIYQGLVYLTALPGGWLADRVLGARRAVLWGGAVIMCGHIAMAVPVPGPALIWVGLTLIVAGTGLLKPNISSMVGHLYRDDEDARRDSGFSLFYMGINIGAFAGIFVTPALAGEDRWHLAFGAAAVGMAVGLAQYVLGGRHLRGAGLRPGDPLTAAERARAVSRVGVAAAAVAAVALAAASAGMLTVDNVTYAATAVTVAVPVAYFVYILRHPHVTADERRRMAAYIWLFAAAAIFWMIFDLAPGPVTGFARNHVDLTVFGYAIPAGWTQNFNSLFVIVFAGVFAALWLKVGDRVGSPAKFAFALFMAGLSFVVLSAAAGIAEGGAKVGIAWLALMYLIQTFGELSLSPVGLSVTAKLAPVAFKGQMLGVWFLASAVGDSVGGQTYRLRAFVSETQYFLLLAAVAVLAGLVLLAWSGRLRHLTGEHIPA